MKLTDVLLQEASKQEMESVAIKIVASLEGKDKEEIKDNIYKAYDLINQIGENLKEPQNYLPLISWMNSFTTQNYIRNDFKTYLYLVDNNMIESYSIDRDKAGKLYKNIRLQLNYPSGKSDEFKDYGEFKRKIDALYSQFKQKHLDPTNISDVKIAIKRIRDNYDVIYSTPHYMLVKIPASDPSPLDSLCELMDIDFCIRHPRDYFNYRVRGSTFYVLIDVDIWEHEPTSEKRMIVIEVADDGDYIKATSALNVEDDLGEDYIEQNYPRIIDYLESEPVSEEEELVKSIMENPEELTPKIWSNLDDAKQVLLKNSSIVFPAGIFKLMSDKEIYLYLKERMGEIHWLTAVDESGQESENVLRYIDKNVFNRLIKNNWEKFKDSAVIYGVADLLGAGYKQTLFNVLEEIAKENYYDGLNLAFKMLMYDKELWGEINQYIDLNNLSNEILVKYLLTNLELIEIYGPQRFSNEEIAYVGSTLNYSAKFWFYSHLSFDRFVEIMNEHPHILRMFKNTPLEQESRNKFFTKVLKAMDFENVMSFFKTVIGNEVGIFINMINDVEFVQKIVDNFDEKARKEYEKAQEWENKYLSEQFYGLVNHTSKLL